MTYHFDKSSEVRAFFSYRYKNGEIKNSLLMSL